jgi:hypothetical protein
MLPPAASQMRWMRRKICFACSYSVVPTSPPLRFARSAANA